jgi:hypothetical protein
VVSEKEIRQYVLHKFGETLVADGFSRDIAESGSWLIYSRTLDEFRSIIITVETKSRYGVAMGVRIGQSFSLLTSLIEKLLIRPELKPKARREVLSESKHVFNFFLAYSAIESPDASLLTPSIKSIEEADRYMQLYLNQLRGPALRVLEKYSSISSLRDCLENPTIGFNKHILFNHYFIPLVYELTGDRQKAIDYVNENYLLPVDNSGYTDKHIVDMRTYGQNIITWIGAGTDRS